MVNTTNLALPLIAASQAQKHVTHNDSLRLLDTVVMLSIINATTTAPPGSPSEGDRYIPAATATGDWTGEEDNIAAFQDGAWAFYTPQDGWLCFNEGTSKFIMHDGTDWTGPIGFGVVNTDNLSVTGNITVTGTVDGRDVAADGTKLDAIEALADVTDTVNVTAAGALMDSELTSIASVKALDQGVAVADSPVFDKVSIARSAARFDLNDTGGTSTHAMFSLVTDNDRLFIQTRSDIGGFVAQNQIMVVGASGATAHEWLIQGTPTVLVASAAFRPSVDDTAKLGAASFLWKEVFSAIGTINTSDAREKTEVRRFTNNEIKAAKELAGEIGIYKFLKSIRNKGDAAREHIGMTVQRAIEVMEKHGLDPFNYGFICYDEWDEAPEVPELLEKGTGAVLMPFEPVKPAGNRYSFRPDQLSGFIARGFEARLSRIEAKLKL